MITFERRTLQVELQQTVVTLNITLTDTETDASLDLEAKRLGNLDVKALLELMMMSDQQREDGVDEEAARTE